jgi:hypothetical protein
MNVQSSVMKDRLHPEVIAFQHRVFTLGRDLERLERVRQAEAPEAAVLYAGRILEVLSGAALVQVGLTPTSQVFNNLVRLEQLNLLPVATRCWAHTLRNIANDARHVRRELSNLEAEVSLIFVERWLHWYFCQFRFGPCLPALWSAEAGRAVDSPLARLVADLDRPDLDNPRLAQLAQAGEAVWRMTPVLSAGVLELLIERGEHAAADELLKVARAGFPDEPRLVQLHGLLCSRTDRLEEAWKCLDELAQTAQLEDESLGIRGGVAKRLWRRDGKRSWLQESHRLYARGWQHSEQTNPYLGINTATTALWLGDRKTARLRAGEVSKLIQAERDLLVRRQPGADLMLGFWDEVTLAEADLLLDHPDDAKRRYEAAFARYASLHDNIKVAREQALEILRALGGERRAQGFFA